MRASRRQPLIAGLSLLLALGACGGRKDAEGNAALASLDTRLTNGMVMVNGNAVGATYPADTQGGAGASNAAAAVEAPAANVADSINAAAPVPADPRSHAGNAAAHLAALEGRAVGGCAGRDLHYGDQWAKAMPPALVLYPGATLVEAAGTDTGRCALRVISFTTADGPDRVLAHYEARVRAAGYDAERQFRRTEVRLGGTRASNGAAYMLFARRAGPRTEVDIVATAD